MYRALFTCQGSATKHLDMIQAQIDGECLNRTALIQQLGLSLLLETSCMLVGISRGWLSVVHFEPWLFNLPTHGRLRDFVTSQL